MGTLLSKPAEQGCRRSHIPPAAVHAMPPARHTAAGPAAPAVPAVQGKVLTFRQVEAQEIVEHQASCGEV